MPSCRRSIAQRIVRAKRILSDSGLAYETPRGEDLSERLSSVLEVVYLIFNEGYTAARGEDWLRPQLCNEALRLGRVLTAVAPHEPEAHGLLALMELNASRTAARTDAMGEPIVRSPIVELNRAIAIGMAEGPDVGLAIVDGLLSEPALKRYHLLPSVRGDLLHKLGRYEEARAAFEAAATLAGNRREQELLRRRAAKAADAAMSS